MKKIFLLIGLFITTLSFSQTRVSTVETTDIDSIAVVTSDKKLNHTKYTTLLAKLGNDLSVGATILTTKGDILSHNGTSSLRLPSGTNGQILSVDTSTTSGLKWIDNTGGGGSGTVTNVSIVSANGITGSVANATTTPAITLSLGAITPTTIVASGVISGSNLSGTNTGDSATNTQYASDYRAANFVAGTHYLAPNGNGSALTGLTKTQVGLSNVDNTSDANKPISTATQTALDGKQATLVSGTNIKTINGNSLLGSGDLTISGGGSPTFVGLTDTPSSFTGEAGKFYKVNSGETALETTDLVQQFDPLTHQTPIKWVGTQAQYDVDFPSGHGTREVWITDATPPALTVSDISDLTATATELNYVIGATSNIQTQLNAKNSYPSGDATKVGYITVTQAVNLDTMESDIATNNAKVSNATHTGEVTGSTALTVNPTAISNKTLKSTLAGTEEVLINDAGTLKKTTAQDIADLGGGGAPAEITTITKYSTFASLPSVTGSETDTYAYVEADSNLALRGLYTIQGGSWKLLYHFEDLNIPVKRVSKNWIDLSQPVVGGTPTATSQGIINNYNFNNSADGISSSGGDYITNYIPVKKGDRLIKNGSGMFWMYYHDKTAIPWSAGIIPYNFSNVIEITNDQVGFVRWSGSIADKNTTGAIIKQYDTTTNTAMSGWDDFNGTSTNFQRDNTNYTYEAEGRIFKKPTTNLFDWKNAEYTQGYNNDGSNANTDASTGFIPIKGGFPYSINTSATAISFWDGGKTFISGTSGVQGLAPSTASYVSFLIDPATDFKTVVVNQNVKANDNTIYNVSTEILKNETRINKTVCLIGDSIGTEDDTYATTSSYASLMRNILRIDKFHNISVSGKALSNYQTDINTGRYATPVADVYIIALGTNDFGYNRALGTISDTAATDTFYGSMQDLVEGLLALNANAKIVWFTPLARSTQYTNNAAGNKLQAYRDAIIRKAQSRGDAWLDLKDCINPFNSQLNTNWFISADGLHPNNAAHSAFILPKILNFLKAEIE